MKRFLTTMTAAIAVAIYASCAVSADTASTSSGQRLTLDRCVALALENNAAARISTNDMQSAVELRREAFTKYFPEVWGSFAAFRTHNDVFQYNLLDIVELGLINKGKMAGIQALQPVFTGGRIVNGNKLAAVGEEVARLRRQQTDNDLRLNTETMFWKLATLESTRGVLKAALATLDTLDYQIKTAVDAGVAMKNDLLKVQLKRNTYRMEQVDLENGIRLMKMLLGQYIGHGTAGDFDIAFDVPDSVPAYPLDIYVPADEAVSSTIDYDLLRQNVRAKTLERRIEIGRNLPTVALGAGWFYHDLLSQNNNFGALMVAVNVPLSGWWGGSHAIRRKTLALENAKAEFEDLGQKLRIGVQDKWDNLTAAHRKMEIAAEGIVQSAENLRLNILYYETGISTVTQMLDAEASHKQSRDAYVAAYGEFCTARAAYLNAIAPADAGR